MMPAKRHKTVINHSQATIGRTKAQTIWTPVRMSTPPRRGCGSFLAWSSVLPDYSRATGHRFIHRVTRSMRS